MPVQGTFCAVMKAMTSTYANALANRQLCVIAMNIAPRAVALRWYVANKRTQIGQEGTL